MNESFRPVDAKIHGEGEFAMTTVAPTTFILETPRLALRWLALDDAPFIVELVNEPGWLRFIGDKHVHGTEDAHRFLREGPIAMYVRYGFGLYCVERKSDRQPLGMCGLIRREGLVDVDIGFGFLERFAGQGFAFEAAQAVVGHAKSLGLRRIVAITTPDNHASQHLLRKLGMRFEQATRLSDTSELLHLFVADLD